MNNLSLKRPPALQEALETLTRQELTAKRAVLYDELEHTEDVALLYTEQVLPLEREFIWRAQLDDDAASIDLLFITVGAQPDTPINAGLRWRAKQVVFLHTADTLVHANTAAERLGLGLSQARFESVGSGDEVLELYRKIKEVWQNRGQPATTVVDVTGGYKTMSAAAGAVSFVVGMTATYVATRQRRFNKTTVWLDTEVRILESPLKVFGDVRRQVAHELLVGGRYLEAQKAYEDLERDVGERPDSWRSLLAGALAASDNLNVSDAERLFGECSRTIEQHLRLEPSLKEDSLVSQLGRIKSREEGINAIAEVVGQEDLSLESMSAPGFLDLIAYLIARAQDRSQRGELDFAAMFAYRALEAITQRRLAKGYGYHVSNFDWSRLGRETNLSEEEIKERLERTWLETHLSKGTANRILMLFLNDGMLSKLGLKGWDGLGESRNKSILAHGTTQISAKAMEGLLRNTKDLFETLLRLEDVSDESRDELLARHAPIVFTL